MEAVMLTYATGEPIIEDGAYLLQDKSTGNIMKIPIENFRSAPSDALISTPSDAEIERELQKSSLQKTEENDVAHWDDKSCKLLISTYQIKKKLVEERKIKSLKKMWEAIQVTMAEYRFTYTAPQCENKWKSLERAYKSKLLNSKKTGRGRKTCPYEKEMEEILGKRHSIRPPCTLGRASEEVVAEQDEQFIEQVEAGPSSRSFNLEDPEEGLLEESFEETPTKRRKTVRSSTQTELQKIRIIEEKKLEHKIKMDEVRTRQRQEYIDATKKKNELLEKILSKQSEN